MGNMFEKCTSLENLNVSSFDTKNVTNMEKMFSGCLSIEELDLSNFDTSQVKQIKYMFCNCTSLKRLDFSKFNTNHFALNNNEDMFVINSMFMGCSEELSKKYRNKKEENEKICIIF